MRKDLEDRVKEVVQRDGRYHLQAYLFLYEALDHTIRTLRREGHVTGRELLRGIQDLAQERFGGLAPMVFQGWGVLETADFGNIVFNLVEAKLMGRSATDSIDDFKDVYDFREAFRVDTGPRRAPKG